MRGRNDEPILICASYNRGKIVEYQKLMEGGAIRIKSLLDFDAQPLVHETGQSLSDNAVIKARTSAEFYGMPAFAEDTGLEVYVLDGAPGVRTKRFAGENSTDQQNIDKLLWELKDVPFDRRGARFRTVICLAFPTDDKNFEEYLFEGECEGLIALESQGFEGFGYDPVFFIPSLGITFSQAGVAVKNEISHRRKAAEKLLTFLEEQDPFRLVIEN